MNTIASLTTREIPVVLPQTVKAFYPLLLANKEAIFSVPKTTHRYGPHPRHELDVYKPTDRDISQTPIFVFFHGGGLVQGGKEVGYVPDHLVYHNLGAFFARRGFITIIPNYRLVNDPVAGTGHDAVFPSGAVDVSLVLSWIEKTYPGLVKTDPRNIFVMGNSAGGIHIMTWLFHAQFSQQRQHLVSESQVVRLKAIINHSGPITFPDPPSSPKGIYDTDILWGWPVRRSSLHLVLAESPPRLVQDNGSS